MWRRFFALVALTHFLCAAAAFADITSASLEIQGAGLRLETVSVTTGLDIPTTIQTSFGNKTNDQSPAVPGLLAVGDLTGPGIDIPIQLTTTPGYRFNIPGLTRLGDYYLQNVRLMNGNDVIQRATPSLAKITVADLFQTSLSVKQLTPEEIRARGIVIDARNYDVYGETLVAVLRYRAAGDLVWLADQLGFVLQPATRDLTKIAQEALRFVQRDPIPDAISDAPAWRQPWHQVIAGVPLFMFAGAGRLEVHVAGAAGDLYAVTSEDVDCAAYLEDRWQHLEGRFLDPPVDDERCISPFRYPDFFT